MLYEQSRPSAITVQFESTPSHHFPLRTKPCHPQQYLRNRFYRSHLKTGNAHSPIARNAERKCDLERELTSSDDICGQQFNNVKPPTPSETRGFLEIFLIGQHNIAINVWLGESTKKRIYSPRCLCLQSPLLQVLQKIR
ncbi:MAG: hypothetical protein LBP41_00915 [Holosporaceae bacterium]|jgi:hypothetical protein|nr:hypothetical protein [Holosporaceae bacterium]